MAEDNALHICAVSQSQLDVQRLSTKALTQLVLVGINYYLCARKTHFFSLMQTHTHAQIHGKTQAFKK